MDVMKIPSLAQCAGRVPSREYWAVDSHGRRVSVVQHRQKSRRDASSIEPRRGAERPSDVAEDEEEQLQNSS